IQPSGLHGVGAYIAILEHVLSVEMRTLAIGARNRVERHELTRRVALAHERQARMQTERVVELQHTVRLARCAQSQLATQACLVRITVGRCGGETIQSTTQNDEDETRCRTRRCRKREARSHEETSGGQRAGRKKLTSVESFHGGSR